MCGRPASQIAQRGAALLALIVMLVLGATAVFYELYSSAGPDIEKERKTAAALAQAKAALIGFASGVSNFAGGARPGDLPCPDTNDSGSAGSPNCNSQSSRLGRLPWKTLRLPDLRDGDGERLWYAVSNNFKSSSRTSCLAPGDAGCLNSDTRGTITIRDSAGNIFHDAANADATASGVIAVIFSPGAVLRRQDGTLQNRTCVGSTGCAATGVCNASSTPKCNPVNYLDIIIGTEDNADFLDGSGTNGFIRGIVRDAGGNVLVNDRLITITYEDLMPLLERRVANETLNCLSRYASASPNVGRYPWAAADTTYVDVANTVWGRMPDSNLTRTATSAPAVMPNFWPATCTRTQGTWWTNWKDQVFYGVADAYKPGTSPPAGCPACISVNPPSAAADKQVVVMVAGRRLPTVAGGQPRTSVADKQTATNYLEGGNHLYPSFTQQAKSATFNDTVVYK